MNNNEKNIIDGGSNESNGKNLFGDAKNLSELLEMIQGYEGDEHYREKAMENLPTFGGETPTGSFVVWSWDETHMLVGDGGYADLQIVPRDYFDE